ncbi:DNA/RNA non-specific endonuclease [Cylindrospermopsis raciborskii]|uniref:Endonuclease n=1 Tax=Cylindrospermopsis raciborskii CENA302 TaxID=1170768 RepID=A0A9Q5QZ73_9CYAN|nr:DNA/RNA non-specific endonuclease [Cylindrospermopsis raciborskii]NLQ06574.1 DNA/RNA non-specific endonuclease [Cylindrospermopsis raciborskii MVCC19]OHY34342.1 nuclease [Cylindrospermopsis raciborskii MVCC14]OPH10819.1 nuclease [Cylindrospermopsis raciborskii CENA302]
MKELKKPYFLSMPVLNPVIFATFCLFINLTLIVLTSCIPAKALSLPTKPNTIQSSVDSIHLLLGNPSNATSSLDNPDNYLMIKPQYALSYNRSHGSANWVAWQLDKSWLGDAKRQDDFRPDDTLPDVWTRVKPSVYNSSGYDRGHIARSADRTQSVEDNSATFLMTNIIPQTPDNNRNTWGNLEDYSMKLAEEGKQLYIIAGGFGDKGKLKNLVTIPQYTWKIIVVLDRPGLGLQDVNSNTRVIAVNIPNDEQLDNNWRLFRTSVDKLEELTGYDFLSTVSPNIQKVIESQIDNL